MPRIIILLFFQPLPHSINTTPPTPGWTAPSQRSFFTILFSFHIWFATHVLIDIPPYGPLLLQQLQKISSETERKLELRYIADKKL